MNALVLVIAIVHAVAFCAGYICGKCKRRN
jgi:hypothetical protein